MRSESQFILEIWELVRDHLPTTRRPEIAAGILRAAEEYGFEARDLRDVTDDDQILAKAHAEVFDEDPRDDFHDNSDDE